jgi:hypothetical protein
LHGSAWKITKAPSTSPFLARIGWDHAECNPWLRAKSRKSAHRGSRATAETTTRLFKNAAVPHEAAEGPMGNRFIAPRKPLGIRLPATGLRWLPSESTSIANEKSRVATMATEFDTENHPTLQVVENTSQNGVAGRQGFEPRYRGPESGARASVRFGRCSFRPFLSPRLRFASVRSAALACNVSHRVSPPRWDEGDDRGSEARNNRARGLTGG